MADTYADRIVAKIAILSAEIERVQADSKKTVQQLKGQITLLEKAAKAVTPEVETLLSELKTQGLI